MFSSAATGETPLTSQANMLTIEQRSYATLYATHVLSSSLGTSS